MNCVKENIMYVKNVCVTADRGEWKKEIMVCQPHIAWIKIKEKKKYSFKKISSYPY